MISIACAAPVEAVKAHIEAGWIVDRVEALSTVFPVDRLRRAWRPELYGMLAQFY